MGAVSGQLPALGVHCRPPGHSSRTRLERHLAGSAARWVPTASLLVANLSHIYVADADWEYSSSLDTTSVRP